MHDNERRWVRDLISRHFKSLFTPPSEPKLTVLSHLTARIVQHVLLLLQGAAGIHLTTDPAKHCGFCYGRKPQRKWEQFILVVNSLY